MLSEVSMSVYNLKSVLSFLADLAINNKRTWFEEHKAVYEKARTTFERFVEELIHHLSAYADLSGVTAKDSMMRIYRDVRFSKDKTPYNAWMAAMIAPGGKKSGRLGFGLRLAPEDSGAAGGLWDPSTEQLDKFRRTVDRDSKAFSALVEAPDFGRMFGGLRGERLKTAPKGYAKDHPAVELLKLKQVYAARSFPDQAVFAGDFMDQLVATFLAMRPFLEYLDGVTG
jgi:uncharacterized protein (TIGR02453 family)